MFTIHVRHVGRPESVIIKQSIIRVHVFLAAPIDGIRTELVHQPTTGNR
jgi:hypothetical protein